MWGETMKNYVYLIGIIYPYGELTIMGVYTEGKLLIEAYDKLVSEDGRCTALKYPEEPVIYKIPLNKFLGEKVPWAQIIDGKSCFYTEDNIECITIGEIKSHVKVTSFYGMNVYCDLNFTNGAYVDLEYTGGGENDYCWSRMNIEDGSTTELNKYTRDTVNTWYQENRKYLMKLYQTKKLIDFPKWDK